MKLSTKASPSKQPLRDASGGVDVPPVAELDLSTPLKIVGLASSDQYLKVPSRSSKKQKKKKRKRTKSKEEQEENDADADAEDSSAPTHTVNRIIEMPEGATLSDHEESHLPEDDPHRALDIDLDM